MAWENDAKPWGEKNSPFSDSCRLMEHLFLLLAEVSCRRMNFFTEEAKEPVLEGTRQSLSVPFAGLRQLGERFLEIHVGGDESGPDPAAVQNFNQPRRELVLAQDHHTRVPIESRKQTQIERSKREEKRPVVSFSPSSFSSHLVASIDNLLVFSLLREKGERGRERETESRKCTYFPLEEASAKISPAFS